MLRTHITEREELKKERRHEQALNEQIENVNADRIKRILAQQAADAQRRKDRLNSITKDYKADQPPDCVHPYHAQQRMPQRGHHRRDIRKQSPCPHSVASGHLNLDLGSQPVESLPMQSPAGLLANVS